MSFRRGFFPYFLVCLPVLFPQYLLALSGPLFDFSCQRILHANGVFNTRIRIIQFPQDGTESQLIVQFRQNNRNVYELSRYLKASAADTLREFWITLPDGYYEVWAEMRSLSQPGNQINSTTFFARNVAGRTAVSDISLLHSRTDNPVLNSDIPGAGQQFSFSCFIYPFGANQLTARAVLYRQDENPYSDAAGKYTSLGQVSAPITGSPNQTFTFESPLPADSLESGNYLIEVFVYQEDQIIAEASYSFNVLWHKVPGMLADPEPWLPAMAWRFPNGAVPEELSQPAAFLNYWLNQNENNGVYPYAALEEFYKKWDKLPQFLNTADAMQSVKSKYFLLLGEPDSVTLTSSGTDSLSVWFYNSPPLQKYFIKPEGESEWAEMNILHKLRLSLNL